jgi:hypothetical protein
MSERLRCGLFVMGTDGGSYADILDQAVLAEQRGFDSVVLAERHLRHAELLCPSPFEVGAAIAARTERMRIGVAGRILALDHPVHVAEAAATLDVLSEGAWTSAPRARASTRRPTGRSPPPRISPRDGSWKRWR